MKNFFRAQFKDKGTAKINGQSYYGETITGRRCCVGLWCGVSN